MDRVDKDMDTSPIESNAAELTGDDRNCIGTNLPSTHVSGSQESHNVDDVDITDTDESGGIAHERVPSTSSNVYDFTHVKRGKALIFGFSMKKGEDGDSPEKSWSPDVQKYIKALEFLGFVIDIIIEASSEAIKKRLEAFCSESHEAYDCVAFAFSSHGCQVPVNTQPCEQGTIPPVQDAIFTKEGLLHIQDIIDILQGPKALSLTGKPKLIFVNACRGNNCNAVLAFDRENQVTVVSKMVVKDPPSVLHYRLPRDFLISYSGPSGFKSFRRTQDWDNNGKTLPEGSWFVQELLDVIMKHGHTLELLDILTVVNIQLIENHPPDRETPDRESRPTPSSFMSSLRDSVYFYPKTTPSS